MPYAGLVLRSLWPELKDVNNESQPCQRGSLPWIQRATQPQRRNLLEVHSSLQETVMYSGMTRKEWKLMDIEYLLSSFHCLSSFYIVNFIPAILPESKPLPSLSQMKPIENALQTRVMHGECGRMKARTHQSFTAL